MTYAPATLKEIRPYLEGKDPDLDDNELGIVGNAAHVKEGTGYHLGKDQLKMSLNPYSARTARDKAGLADADIANAACAFDIDDDWDYLRPFSVWAVQECRANAPDTRDIREIIYSPDGQQVLRWDRERGVTSAPQPSTQLDHRTHSHISRYRDATRRQLLPLFQRFYREVVGSDGPIPTGVITLYAHFGDGENPLPPSQAVKEMQLDGIELGYDLAPFGGADGRYGGGTAGMLVALIGVEVAGDGHTYEADQRHAMQQKLRLKYAGSGGTVGKHVTFTLPAEAVTVQNTVQFPEVTVTGNIVA